MTAHRSLAAALATSLVAAVAVACKGVLFSELEPKSDEVPRTNIVDVSRVGSGDLRANGTDTARFRVRLPGRATDGVVTLTTSAGVWVESGGGELKVRAISDSGGARLIAEALLRAPRDTVARLAVVRAMVTGTYYDTVSVRFTP